MTKSLAVWNCRQLITMSGPARARTGAEMREIGLIAGGAMLVRDGRIAAVGTRAEIEPLLSKEAELVDAGGGIVLPGFVDAHTHPVFAGTRADEFEERTQGTNYAEIAARGGGIRATVRRTREASEVDLLSSARRYREWFLKGGTTTIEAKSGYGLSPESELKILRVIRDLGGERRLQYVPTFLGAHEVPDEYRGRMDDYLEVVIQEMLPQVAAEKLAEYCDVFCEPSVFPADKARLVLDAAKRAGLKLRIHADQFTPDAGALLAAELGAATADHLEATGPSGWQALQRAGVQPVLLPGSVYALGLKKFAAAREMIGRGLPVVIATDFNPGSSPTASMPIVISLAATQMKMMAAECLTAATINAAYSLGRGHSIGSLEVGKQADFAVHDCDDYREIPYFFGRESARAVYIGGDCTYKFSGF
jgi:imidazolonepropionase